MSEAFKVVETKPEDSKSSVGGGVANDTLYELDALKNSICEVVETDSRGSECESDSSGIEEKLYKHDEMSNSICELVETTPSDLEHKSEGGSAEEMLNELRAMKESLKDIPRKQIKKLIKTHMSDERLAVLESYEKEIAGLPRNDSVKLEILNLMIYMGMSPYKPLRIKELVKDALDDDEDSS